MRFSQRQLHIHGAAVTGIAGNQFPAISLICILHIIDNIADGRTDSAPFADMQGHYSGGCIDKNLFSD